MKEKSVISLWEIKLPEMPHLMVFIIPSELVKNGDERLVVCNHAARKAVEDERGKHDKYVFTYKRKPISRMNSTAWRNARIKAGLEHVRVHDLKHTFGRRLRAVGVSFEDRQDLLGHRSGRITTHYSSAELQNLLEAANRVCEKQQSGVVLSLLRNPNNRASTGKIESSKVISL
ncbi:Phage integrase [Legionella micdadei]|uniref:Phage integrase n=1 Tax=Legionella micdadei TaxID=451 RepID=A0A098GG65_LEGMI|nr:integrase [Legionella micdadei]CEG61474.1 Phage integrase [Legionella micdadei]SCY42024.1 Phage integrase family protein [Legionella micdadei]